MVCNDSAFFASHFQVLAETLSNQGHEVVIVAGGATPALVRRFNEAGCRLINIPIVRSSSNPLRELMTLASLFFQMLRQRPDVVHLFTIKPCLYGGFIARLLRVKSVFATITGLGYAFIGESLKAKIRRRIFINGYRFAFAKGANKCLIFENTDDLQLFRLWGVIDESRSRRVWGAGVDLDKFRPGAPDMDGQSGGPRGDVVALLPSRLLRDKGVVEFIEAARILKARGVPVRMVLAGGIDPHNRASLTLEEVEQYDREGAVAWIGYQSNMAEVLNGADIVCLPSYREGMPKVLLEAMACGKAIVTTDVPGCREVIVEGEQGFLVPVKDAEALAEKIEYLASDADLRERMGQSSRQRAEHLFGDRQIADQYTVLYRSLGNRS